MKINNLNSPKISDTSCQTNTPYIRKATIDDLDFIIQLERKSFPEHKQSPEKSIKHSILSPSQLVFISEFKTETHSSRIKTGSMIALLYKRSIRIYSIAVEKKFRNCGIGKAMLNEIVSYAYKNDFEKLILEADANNQKLIEWYKNNCFEITMILNNYYGFKENAYKMIKKVKHPDNIASPSPTVRVTLS